MKKGYRWRCHTRLMSKARSCRRPSACRRFLFWVQYLPSNPSFCLGAFPTVYGICCIQNYVLLLWRMMEGDPPTLIFLALKAMHGSCVCPLTHPGLPGSLCLEEYKVKEELELIFWQWPKQ